MLFDYYEKRGDYVRAEEQISDLLRIEDQVYAVLPGIINYYESKLALSDRELSAGGVTRGEFIDRLAAVKNLLAEDN